MVLTTAGLAIVGESRGVLIPLLMGPTKKTSPKPDKTFPKPDKTFPKEQNTYDKQPTLFKQTMAENLADVNFNKALVEHFYEKLNPSREYTYEQLNNMFSKSENKFHTSLLTKESPLPKEIKGLYDQHITERLKNINSDLRAIHEVKKKQRNKQRGYSVEYV